MARALGRRRDEDAGRGREPQGSRVMLGEVIGVEAGRVVSLGEAQAALVELVERHVPPVEMVEDPDVHVGAHGV